LRNYYYIMIPHNSQKNNEKYSHNGCLGFCCNLTEIITNLLYKLGFAFLNDKFKKIKQQNKFGKKFKYGTKLALLLGTPSWFALN
jgi:hypothetical protein